MAPGAAGRAPSARAQRVARRWPRPWAPQAWTTAAFARLAGGALVLEKIGLQRLLDKRGQLLFK
jgi:hypothetical protein